MAILHQNLGGELCVVDREFSDLRFLMKPLIAEYSSNQRKFFLTTDPLICEPADVSFLDHIPPNDLANNFGNYFVQKIEYINGSLDILQSSEPLDSNVNVSADNMGTWANFFDPDPRKCAVFPNLKTLT